uniref:HU-CCDC81_euk_2 domain-containing protein n=1 Tax=Macrostomum lignano TaxID=282301 RepID=A0A1I8HNB7_9PLAT
TARTCFVLFQELLVDENPVSEAALEVADAVFRRIAGRAQLQPEGLAAACGSGCISRSNFLAMFAAQLLRDRDAAAEDLGSGRADFALAPADLRWLTRRMASKGTPVVRVLLTF